MNKTEKLIAELAKLGIHNEAQLKERMKNTSLNISLMVWLPKQERTTEKV